MSEKLLDCVIISADRRLQLKAAGLMADSQRGLNLAAQYTTPLSDIGKAQAEEIRQTGARLILLDLGEDPNLGLRLARFLATDNPGLTFVITGPPVAPQVLLEAMRLGASEYLDRPVEDADLSAALTRAVRRVVGLHAQEQTAPQGRLTVVYGAKGGVGVTTTATNTALALHQATGQRTLLIDLDLEMGSTALALGMHPRYSVLDVVRNLHRLDSDLLSSYIDVHDSGVGLLASPADHGSRDAITRDQARSMLQFLRRNYDQVVADVGHVMSPVTLAAFEVADTILVLTTPDVASLNNTKKALPLIAHAAVESQRIRVVLNARQGGDVIGVPDVRKALEHDVFTSLARDESVVESLNTGKPAVLGRKSKYARDVASLVEQLIGVHSTNGKGNHRRRIWPFGGRKHKR